MSADRIVLAGEDELSAELPEEDAELVEGEAGT